MELYLIMAVATVLLAQFVQRKEQEYFFANGRMNRSHARNLVCLLSIFLALFLVAALRENIGNDYNEYKTIFNNIHEGKQVSSEIGFNLVVSIFQLLFGAETYLPIFAFFSGITIIFFMKAIYEQSEWFGLSFFLFMMSGYYFSSLNTVRYYFAFAIALYAARYAYEKDWGRFLLWILFAASFHKTVLVVIPVYWFASREWKKKEYAAVILVALSMLFCQELYRKIIFAIYPYYQNSQFDNGQLSYMNIAKCLAIVLFCLLFYRKSIQEQANNRFYFQLSLGALLLYLSASFIPEVSRIAYYFIGGQVFLIGNVLREIESKKMRYLWIGIISIAFLGYFFIFMKRASGVELRLIPYQTWVFSNK